MSLGKRLREERATLGLTQTGLATACEVTKRAQIRFEQDMQIPGGAYLIAAAAHGVDVKYVLVGERGVGRLLLPLDKGLLHDCIEGVERGLKAMGRTLANGPKAELIVECYELFRERGGASRAKVMEFVKRAA